MPVVSERSRPSTGTILGVALVGAAAAAFVGYVKGVPALPLVVAIVVMAVVSALLAAGARPRRSRREVSAPVAVAAPDAAADAPAPLEQSGPAFDPSAPMPSLRRPGEPQP